MLYKYYFIQPKKTNKRKKRKKSPNPTLITDVRKKKKKRLRPIGDALKRKGIGLKPESNPTKH